MMRIWRLVVTVLVVLGTAYLFWRWYESAQARVQRHSQNGYPIELAPDGPEVT